ncbi:MAG: YbaB/EbfC family nucleoid-associated protein [Anaerolineaceae bacterium]|nr:YbaB/EbfC family nucleoid-associated protein [Anaerolineaceae bacterium]
MSKGYNRQGGSRQSGMLGRLQKMQEQLAEAQAKLAEETVTATVGGGALKITMTGDQHCVTVEIDPELVKSADTEMLQDLLLSGINLALDQSREMAATKLSPLTGGLGNLGI